MARISIDITSKLIGKGFDKTRQQLKRLQKQAKSTSAAMNQVLGGKGRNIGGGLNTMGQNISSISNRLGFMAFQWNFMANAANRAVQVVLGGLSEIIQAGAKTSDAITRAMAFGTSAMNIGNMTQEGAEDLKRIQDLILSLGTGQTIFDATEISGQVQELQKALDDLPGVEVIAPFAAMLKTIEPTISDVKLGTGLVSVFQAFQTDVRDVKEVGKVMDFIANVSNKSTANIQSTIASLGVSLQQAKAIGFEAREVGVIIGTVSDVLARNQGGGRASATPGRFLNAFITDIRALQDIRRKQGKSGAFFGLELFDDEQKLKKLPLVMDQFRELFKGKSEQAKANVFSQLGFGTNSIAVVNALLTKSTEQLEDFNEALGERGTLEAISGLISESAGSQIKKIQSSMEGFKLFITNGFSPALRELALLFSGLAGDKDFQLLLTEIGLILSNFVVPHIKTATKLIRFFVKFLQKSPKTLKAVVTAVILLITALVGLSIIATIGFFALVAASSMAGLTGQMFLAAGATKVLSGAMTGLFRRFFPVAIIGIGLALIALSLSGIFDDSLTPAIGALGVGITALGATMLLGVGRMKMMGLALVGVVSQIANMRAASTAFTGNHVATMGTAGTAGAGRFGMNFIRGIGKAGIIGAVIAVGALAIGGFILAMNERVEKSAFFSKSGLVVNKWQQIGFQMTAATNVFLRQVFDAFLKFGEAVGQFFLQLATFQGKILVAMGRALFVAITTLDVGKAFEALQEGFEDAFAGFDLTNTLGAIFDPTGVTGALQEIRSRLQAFQDEGFTGDEGIIAESIAEVLEAFAVSPEDFGAEDIATLIEEFFGEGVGLKESMTKIVKENDAYLVTQKDFLKINKELTESGKKIVENTEKELEQIKIQTATVATLIDDETELSGEIVANTIITGINTETIDKEIDFLKRGIISIARNTNSMLGFTVIIEQAKLAFLKLAIEGTEAARRLSTLRVSKKGVFSMSGRQTTTTFDEIGPLANSILIQMQNIADAQTIFEENLTNIMDLTEALNKLTDVLAVANKAGDLVNPPPGSPAALAMEQLFEGAGVSRGKSALIATDEQGNVKIDINVDGTFDINVEQGGLTEEDLAELTRILGDQLADQIAAAIGVKVTA